MNCNLESTIGILLTKQLLHGLNYSDPITRLNVTPKMRKRIVPGIKKIRVIQNKILTPFEIADLP
jgi:hypothetical protein